MASTSNIILVKNTWLVIIKQNCLTTNAIKKTLLNVENFVKFYIKPTSIAKTCKQRSLHFKLKVNQINLKTQIKSQEFRPRMSSLLYKKFTLYSA